MELNQIKYFLNLAETLNFTKAARLSGVSQPSLTRSIQRLEDELGARLLYRDGKDTRLTALGRDLQVEFMQIDKVVSNIHDLAESSTAGIRRMLSIGVATTIASSTISEFLASVLRNLPSLELYIHPMLPGESDDEVLSGKYNMCFLPNPPALNPKLSTVILFEERMMLGMSANYHLAKNDIVTPEQMAEEPYLDRIYCEFRTQFAQHFMDRNIVMRPRVQSEREDWVQQLAADGFGVCALPERSGIAKGLALRPVKGLNFTREVTLVAVSGSGNPPEIRQIIDLAKAFNWSM